MPLRQWEKIQTLLQQVSGPLTRPEIGCRRYPQSGHLEHDRKVVPRQNFNPAQSLPLAAALQLFLPSIIQPRAAARAPASSPLRQPFNYSTLQLFNPTAQSGAAADKSPTPPITIKPRRRCEAKSLEVAERSIN